MEDNNNKASQCLTCKVGLDLNRNAICYSPNECSNYKPINNMKYKVGDRVKIKDIDWYNSNKNKDGHVVILPCPFLKNMRYLCSRVVTISRCLPDRYKIEEADYVITDEMIDKLVNDTVITIPDNMEFDKVEDGKIYLKEKKVGLPKTWEECLAKYEHKSDCEYIGGDSDIYHYNINEACGIDDYNHNMLPKDYGKAVLALCQLLICREVYRQGWKPDWREYNIKYTIVNTNGIIIGESVPNYSRVLAFQSEEVRDKFLDNFMDLIEEAKELI